MTAKTRHVYPNLTNSGISYGFNGLALGTRQLCAKILLQYHICAKKCRSVREIRVSDRRQIDKH